MRVLQELFLGFKERQKLSTVFYWILEPINLLWHSAKTILVRTVEVEGPFYN